MLLSSATLGAEAERVRQLERGEHSSTPAALFDQDVELALQAAELSGNGGSGGGGAVDSNAETRPELSLLYPTPQNANLARLSGQSPKRDSPSQLLQSSRDR